MRKGKKMMFNDDMLTIVSITLLVSILKKDGIG